MRPADPTHVALGTSGYSPVQNAVKHSDILILPQGFQSGNVQNIHRTLCNSSVSVDVHMSRCYTCAVKWIEKIERTTLIDLEEPIKEVTVYSDRALVIRSGCIELEAGEHELRVNNLPQFLRDSLRASGRGPGGIRILNVDITTAFRSRPPEVEVVTLQDELE